MASQVRCRVTAYSSTFVDPSSLARCNNTRPAATASMLSAIACCQYFLQTSSRPCIQRSATWHSSNLRGLCAFQACNRANVPATRPVTFSASLRRRRGMKTYATCESSTLVDAAKGFDLPLNLTALEVVDCSNCNDCSCFSDCKTCKLST